MLLDQPLFSPFSLLGRFPQILGFSVLSYCYFGRNLDFKFCFLLQASPSPNPKCVFIFWYFTSLTACIKNTSQTFLIISFSSSFLTALALSLSFRVIVWSVSSWSWVFSFSIPLSSFTFYSYLECQFSPSSSVDVPFQLIEVDDNV